MILSVREMPHAYVRDLPDGVQNQRKYRVATKKITQTKIAIVQKRAMVRCKGHARAVVCVYAASKISKIRRNAVHVRVTHAYRVQQHTHKTF